MQKGDILIDCGQASVSIHFLFLKKTASGKERDQVSRRGALGSRPPVGFHEAPPTDSVFFADVTGAPGGGLSALCS